MVFVSLNCDLMQRFDGVDWVLTLEGGKRESHKWLWLVLGEVGKSEISAYY